MFSAICSAIQELAANAFRLRARVLEQAIGKLLQDPKLAEKFYQHPVISGLHSPRWFRDKNLHKPSYISSGNFASALMALVKVSPAAGQAGLSLTTDITEVKNIAGLEKVLNSLVQGTGKNPEDIRKAIEGWFDASMDRVSGWYKRTAHAWMWLIGLLVCLALNADSISAARLFWNDEALRATTVKAGTEYVQKASNKPPGQGQDNQPDPKQVWQNLSEARQQLSRLNLPLGWCKKDNNEGKLNCWPIAAEGQDTARMDDFAGLGTAWGCVTNLLGILLTVLAISQGAPFWFDTLQKIVNLRLAGDAPNEKKK